LEVQQIIKFTETQQTNGRQRASPNSFVSSPGSTWHRTQNWVKADVSPDGIHIPIRQFLGENLETLQKMA